MKRTEKMATTVSTNAYTGGTCNANDTVHSSSTLGGIVNNNNNKLLKNYAMEFIKENKRVEYARLVLEIGVRVGNVTVSDCEKAIKELVAETTMIVAHGTVNPDDNDRYNTTFEYVESKKNGRDDSLPAYIECIRYLRSKFPNMIIDLEPKISDGTVATATSLAITNKKCPICGELMYADTSVVLTSNPPQYRFVCKICNHSETGRHDNSVTIGFGTISAIGSTKITAEYLQNESKRTGRHPADIAIDAIKKL